VGAGEGVPVQHRHPARGGDRVRRHLQQHRPPAPGWGADRRLRQRRLPLRHPARGQLL